MPEAGGLAVHKLLKVSVGSECYLGQMGGTFVFLNYIADFVLHRERPETVRECGREGQETAGNGRETAVDGQERPEIGR